MIVTVRDKITDFVLYVKKCNAESYEEIKMVLNEVKNLFGEPDVSDMRSGILLAAQEVFSEGQKEYVLYYLRDFGKELMYDYHKELGLARNRLRIKSRIKSILKSISYNQRTLYEIEQGYCTEIESLELMSIKRVLEKLLKSNGSSSYGFPFSLNNLNFYYACKEAENMLGKYYLKIQGSSSNQIITELLNLIKMVTKNEHIKAISNKLSEINRLFQKLRFTFKIPEKGKLSEELSEDE
ncbi:MAG: hypothetical protein QXX11_02755 [Thermoplasmata archaeon]